MIEGVPYDDKEENPLNECEHCDLALDATRWTPRGETFTCGASDTQICCNGFCCDPGQKCNLEDMCEPRPCEIDGITVQPFQRNPQDACQLCDPALSTTAWSSAPDGDPCGPSLDQTCCGGVCGACEPGCFIDGVHYDDGQPRPGPFSCEACNALFPDVWSPRNHPDCPPPCVIDGLLYHYGTLNPANACEVCQGGSAWSESTELVCGEGNQNCCNGACCQPGACCTAEGSCGFDACEPEGCTIDGTQYEDGTLNPGNVCQICQVNLSTTSWTPRFATCGPTDQQFCCGGVCCQLGACCNEGACDLSICPTCVIGGVLIFYGELNPANRCEVCAGDINKFSWTRIENCIP
jgi:hypothetical protein